MLGSDGKRGRGKGFPWSQSLVFHSDFPLPLNRSIIQAIKCKPVSYILIFWPSPLFLKNFAIEVNSSGKEEEENFSNRIFVFMTFLSLRSRKERNGGRAVRLLASWQHLKTSLTLSLSLSLSLINSHTHTHYLTHTRSLST